MRSFFKNKYLSAVNLPIWVFLSFIGASFVAAYLGTVFSKLGLPLKSLNSAVANFLFAVIVYLLTLLIVIGLPWLFKKQQTTLKDLGLNRLLRWRDFLISPPAFVVYVILSFLLSYLIFHLFPWFDPKQVQDNGFEQISQSFELILAFVTLVVVAPFAEEVLFRGYLYGKLRKFLPIWLAVGLTSLLFGFIHGAWNVGIDTFALSILLCLLRERTGSIWSSILLHMIKNSVAFYLLFINPILLSIIGG